ncbi:MAG: hypothetical protein M1818_004783 [Claussenomyces sp. TS43310]|nr:MAG: hypothetical protein M1818_004783 [Claussenomyces sp. TS43310]
MVRPTQRMMMRPTARLHVNGPMTSAGKNFLKSIPVEVYPLGVVIAFGCSFGIYSMAKVLMVDKNLRLSRQRREY